MYMYILLFYAISGFWTYFSPVVYRDTRSTWEITCYQIPVHMSVQKDIHFLRKLVSISLFSIFLLAALPHQVTTLYNLAVVFHVSYCCLLIFCTPKDNKIEHKYSGLLQLWLWPKLSSALVCHFARPCIRVTHECLHLVNCSMLQCAFF